LHTFTQKLLAWSAQHPRNLPWKKTKDPYIIWLSEIILQQTRMEQGTPYFLKFSAAYPTIQDLAKAPEDEVMRLWEGLGYYSRARNMLFTAKYIAKELNGEFPNTYKTIQQLKGVGPYTAAAIASFAFDLPHAVIDGNVYRVLARRFGIDTPIDMTEGKKQFSKLANELLPPNKAAAFNQAIMDFGATHCTPAKPNCATCPMMSDCKAFQTQKISFLPKKSKKIQRKERFFNYIVVNSTNVVFLHKRVKKDIWQHLYEFPVIEHTKLLSVQELQQHPLFKQLLNGQKFKLTYTSRSYKQLLTHQKINALFFNIHLEGQYLNQQEEKLVTVPKEDISKYAFPKIINNYLIDYWEKEMQQLLINF